VASVAMPGEPIPAWRGLQTLQTVIG